MGCATPEIAAAINLDYFYELGRTRRFASHGLGYSSLDDWLAPLVARQDRTLTALNAMLAGGDQLPFVLAGVPAIHGGSALRPCATGRLISRSSTTREGMSRP